MDMSDKPLSRTAKVAAAIREVVGDVPIDFDQVARVAIEASDESMGIVFIKQVDLSDFDSLCY
jgi:ATP-dependent protease HslVU (ClpYQ) ATPase subunit